MTHNRLWLVFDIETVPMPDCADFIEDVQAPSNYKDPAKIDAYVADKRAQLIQEAGLNCDLCEVVAISWGLPEQSHVLTREQASEADLLDLFWRHVRSVQREFGSLVGFNILNFDLLVLLRRSLYLGLPTPRVPIDRYRHDGVIDVAEVLSFGRWECKRSLDFYCKRFRIPHDGSVTGGDVARLVAEGEWATLAAHCFDDMQATKELAMRIGVIERPLPLPESVA